MNAIVPTVPREYMGLARQFYRDAAADFDASDIAFQGIFKPTLDRLSRYPTRKLRDSEFRRLADAWQAMPDKFRLAFIAVIDQRGRAGKIAEFRLGTAKLHNPGWDKGVTEPTLMVGATILQVPLHRGKLMQCYTRATISLHALARRMQRGVDRSQQAILNDMKALVHADLNNAEKYPEDEEFRIPAGNGAWLGVTAPVDDVEDGKTTMQFVVRTFMDNDA